MLLADGSHDADIISRTIEHGAEVDGLGGAADAGVLDEGGRALLAVGQLAGGRVQLDSHDVALLVEQLDIPAMVAADRVGEDTAVLIECIDSLIGVAIS